jgi:hypothetical protein
VIQNMKNRDSRALELSLLRERSPREIDGLSTGSNTVAQAQRRRGYIRCAGGQYGATKDENKLGQQRAMRR